MGRFFVFIIGTICGIYITQNYEVPNVKFMVDKTLHYIKDIEKDSRKNK